MLGTLQEVPCLQEQECEGNYNFVNNVKVLCTPGFEEAFDEEAPALALASQYMVAEKWNHPDYLQVFMYKGIKYWCIADFEMDADPEEYADIGQPYITFLLPSEY